MSNFNYGNQKKKICFDDTDKRYADFKIRLHYDNFKIKEFFNDIISGYLEKNEHIINFIEELKQKKNFSKEKMKKYKKSQEKEQNIIKQFGLNTKDVENIFDILEKEHPEL